MKHVILFRQYKNVESHGCNWLFREKIMQDLHAGALGNDHLGAEKTLAKAKE